MQEFVVGENPFPAEGTPMSSETANRLWDKLNMEEKTQVMVWVNRWRAIGGGFKIIPHDGLIYVEPIRMSNAPLPVNRAMRRKAKALVGELCSQSYFAENVRISTIRAWYASQTTQAQAAKFQ